MSSFCGVWFLSSGQWPQVALDTRHVSKTRYVSCIQRVQWHWPLTETKSLLRFKACRLEKEVVVGDGGFEDSTHNQSTQVWQKLKGNKNQFPKLTGHLKQNEGTFLSLLVGDDPYFDCCTKKKGGGGWVEDLEDLIFSVSQVSLLI